MNLSQDVFQERMDKIAKQCPGTISIVDDVGVIERTEEERNATRTPSADAGGSEAWVNLQRR